MTHRAFHRVRITFLKRHVIHTKYLIQLMPLSALWRQASSRLKWAITKERALLHQQKRSRFPWLAPSNRGAFNSTHIHGTRVPVEEPSTASGPDSCTAQESRRLNGSNSCRSRPRQQLFGMTILAQITS